MKRRILMPLAVIALLLSVYTVYVNSKTVLYVGKINTALVNHKYVRSYDGSQILYLIKIDGTLAKFEQYKVDKNQSLDLVVAKDTEFIVSMAANSIRPYKWVISDVNENKNLEYKGDNFIEPPSFTSLKGDSNRRQNLFLKAVSLGSEKLVLKYINADNSEVDTEIVLNITVK